MDEASLKRKVVRRLEKQGTDCGSDLHKGLNNPLGSYTEFLGFLENMVKEGLIEKVQARSAVHFIAKKKYNLLRLRWDKSLASTVCHSLSDTTTSGEQRV